MTVDEYRQFLYGQRQVEFFGEVEERKPKMWDLLAAPPPVKHGACNQERQQRTQGNASGSEAQ